MGVKRGHKQTELGVFPKDWEIKTIGDLAPFVTSGSRGWAVFYSEFGSPFIRITNLSRASIYLDLRDLRLVNVSHNESEAARTQLRDGDILISITADIGIVGYVTEKLLKPAYINQHIALVRFDSAYNCSRFVCYFLTSEGSRDVFRALADSGSKAGMNLSIVQRILIALPPTKAEQEAIAEALNDADALIESLEQLLSKKRQLKQGAMQELLTGKRRLQGFASTAKVRDAGPLPADWSVKSVSDMGHVEAGKALNAKAAGPQRPYLRTKNVLDGKIDLADVLSMPMEAPEFLRFALKYGDVLLNEGQSLDLVGRCSLYRDEYGSSCAIQNQLIRFRARSGVSVEFAEQLFRHCQATGIFTGIATQTTSVAHLGVSRFKGLRLAWPEDLAEQQEIASVLTEMDSGLEMLEAKLTKARQIKQGMMQELLTGRIRLV